MRYSYVFLSALWRAWKSQKIRGRNVYCESKAGDLSKSVDAGVGAPRSLRENLLSGHLVDCGSERALYRPQAGLYLPPAEGRAVVREGDLPMGHVLCP